MVIHAGATATFLFLRIADTLQIAVVVVDPDQSNVIGHLQSILVDIHRLLVRHKNLGNVFRFLTDVFLQQLALVADHLLDQWHTLLHRQIAFQPFIVNATHGDGIDILILRGL